MRKIVLIKKWFTILFYINLFILFKFTKLMIFLKLLIVFTSLYNFIIC